MVVEGWRSAPDERLPAHRALTCRVGQFLAAIPLSSIVETMRPLPVQPVTKAPDYVLGLAIIRGEPTPVVDLGRAMGSERASATRLVTVHTERRVVALAVDRVLGIRTIPPDSLRAMPALLRYAHASFIDEVGSLDAELLFVLRSAHVVPDDVMDVVEQHTGQQ